MNIELAASEYETWLSVERGLARNSLAAYRRDLQRYHHWLRERHILEVEAISPEIVASYVQWLRNAQTEEGRPRFAASSIARATAAVRGWHRWLAGEQISSDPTSNLDSPKVPAGIPKAISEAEVTSLLDAVLGEDPRALRDRAMLEVMYAAGLRISELVGLDVRDVDAETSTLRVFGKGGKERVVPIGRTARAAIAAYVQHGRPVLHSGIRAIDALFLNARGGRLTRQGCYTIIMQYGKRVGLGDRLSPHVLRHSCATHMLERGADIRIVQELLGHASISTTQVYTKVTPERLRAVYNQAHPRSGQ